MQNHLFYCCSLLGNSIFAKMVPRTHIGVKTLDNGVFKSRESVVGVGGAFCRRADPSPQIIIIKENIIMDSPIGESP